MAARRTRIWIVVASKMSIGMSSSGHARHLAGPYAGIKRHASR